MQDKTASSECSSNSKLPGIRKRPIPNIERGRPVKIQRSPLVNFLLYGYKRYRETKEEHRLGSNSGRLRKDETKRRFWCEIYLKYRSGTSAIIATGIHQPIVVVPPLCCNEFDSITLRALIP